MYGGIIATWDFFSGYMDVLREVRTMVVRMGREGDSQGRETKERRAF